MIITHIDAETNQIVEREATAAEIKEISESQKSAIDYQESTEIALANAKASAIDKLTALGLTIEEAKAITI